MLPLITFRAPNRLLHFCFNVDLSVSQDAAGDVCDDERRLRCVVFNHSRRGDGKEIIAFLAIEQRDRVHPK